MAEGGVVLVGMPWEPLSLPSLQVGVSEDQIREFLDGLAASRLVYRERDRYLALALPPRPREP